MVGASSVAVAVAASDVTVAGVDLRPVTGLVGPADGGTLAGASVTWEAVAVEVREAPAAKGDGVATGEPPLSLLPIKPGARK